jgi:hypothetical protein
MSLYQTEAENDLRRSYDKENFRIVRQKEIITEINYVSHVINKTNEKKHTASNHILVEHQKAMRDLQKMKTSLLVKYHHHQQLDSLLCSDSIRDLLELVSPRKTGLPLSRFLFGKLATCKIFMAATRCFSAMEPIYASSRQPTVITFMKRQSMRKVKGTARIKINGINLTSRAD